LTQPQIRDEQFPLQLDFSALNFGHCLWNEMNRLMMYNIVRLVRGFLHIFLKHQSQVAALSLASPTWQPL